MVLNFRSVRSTVRPELIDEISSKTTVYLRRNIEEVTEKDEVTGDETTFFVYEEAQLTKDEYKIYQVQQAAEEANTQNQLALAELAEALLTE